MPYVYLISSVVCIASTSVLGAFFNRKCEGKKDTTALYTLLSMVSSFLCWSIMFAFDGQAAWKVLPYAVLFAVCFTVCNVCILQALKTGPVVLTSLILQMSLIGVTVWGFFFWGTKFTLPVGIGLALVVIALWLCLYSGKKEGERPITWKWIIYVVLVFVGNAGCTIVQKTQQMQCDGQYGNFLMMIATGLSSVACLVGYLKSNKTDSRYILKKAGYFPVIAGVGNALLNLFVMLLAVPPASDMLPPSVVYPVLAVGGLILTTLCSVFIFKEKMRWWQWIGVAVGIAAVGILNIG